MGGPALRDGGERRAREAHDAPPRDLKQELVEEFGSTLDESLILAIAGERNIDEDYHEIRATLTQLAESASFEQATGFDPSGLGSWAEADADAEGVTSDEPGTSGNCISTEDATTVSDVSDTEVPKFTHQAELGEADQVESLRQIFPNFRDHTLKFILKESNGDLERAFDQLLNRQFLDESGDLAKGVDSFYVFDDGKPASKGKANAHRSRADKQKKKLPLAYTVVSPTINDAELEGSSGLVSPPKASNRLSFATKSSATTSTARQHEWQVVSQSKPSSVPRATVVSAMPDLEATRSNMRAAAALKRLGPLGRQGAVFYIERAREETRRSLAKTSVMAEQLVNQQSTASKIDLHGVTVLDGVRIAKHRVWQWWDNLGENRERLARQHNFYVVTGVGHHSANGVSRLRQAVGTALRNDGWRMETLTGQYCITGRA